MGEEVFIVAIVFGSLVAIVTLGLIGSVIKTWINRSRNNLSENEEFLEALRQFKQKTDRRLSKLEAIIAEEPSAMKQENRKTFGNKADSVVIEEREQREKPTPGGNLENMLKE